jgi:hypothetical protein
MRRLQRAIKLQDVQFLNIIDGSIEIRGSTVDGHHDEQMSVELSTILLHHQLIL